ncbi:hypothetical protein Rsub_02477 [Raphidocelis subcapitata]|uniref:Uncharacterized protein n=1 Tax=Raphidocelis subcapitata TaxID=307507 RepID=A0A2V0NRV8_9CHLO|nr:hypothetical protein Rsub_02477 [Raphidocelis subcapitata]|eukprot:GBF90371.1 hypothetical protein Rsub_02477 [Raphidocelis subcapitata]
MESQPLPRKGSLGGNGVLLLSASTGGGKPPRPSAPGGPAPAASQRSLLLVLAGALLGATCVLPLALLASRGAAHPLHLGNELPGHEVPRGGGGLSHWPAPAAAATLAAAAAAAAANASGAGGFEPVWLGRYALTGAAAEEVVAFARSARAARRRGRVEAKAYLLPPEPHDMRRQHAKVREYLASPAFKARADARRAAEAGPGGGRGIIVNAGGSKLLTSAAVTLAVLRRHLNCSLPVELVWHQAREMDNATLEAFQKEFGPLRGYNIADVPIPAHHRQREALLLDCDNVPLVDPSVFFDDPDYVATGSLFWPDYWRPSEKRDIAFDTVGLEYEPAMAALSAGKGRLPRRDTESGAVVLDLLRHADVAEHAAWINSFSDILYRAVWGDKADSFTQIDVPPGAAFKWRPKMLEYRKNATKVAGWQLAAMVQFDRLASPAFLHRTLNKFWPDADAWPVERLTGPLPYRWVHYYLHQDALGPTHGVPYDYVVPASSLVDWRVNAPLAQARSRGDHWEVSPQEEPCPLATFVDYRRAREAGLPLGPSPALDAACARALPALVGAPRWPAYSAAGFDAAPELLHAAAADFEGVPFNGGDAADPEYSPPREVGDGTPVAAWSPDYDPAAAPGPPRRGVALETRVTAALRAQYEAYRWLRGDIGRFPVIKNGP